MFQSWFLSSRACCTRLMLFSLQIPLWSAYTWTVSLMRSENRPPVLKTGITTHALYLTSNRFLRLHSELVFQMVSDSRLALICDLFAKFIQKPKMQLPIGGLTKMLAHTLAVSLALRLFHLLKPRQGFLGSEWRQPLLFSKAVFVQVRGEAWSLLVPSTFLCLKPKGQHFQHSCGQRRIKLH